jgi:cell division protein FtsW
MAQRVQTDWVLFFTILGMVGFGLLMLYSASSVVAEVRYGSSSYFFLRQLGWALVAIILMMLLKRRDYRTLNSPWWAFASIGVVLASLLLVYFVDPRAHRWLRIGSMGIQPSEFAKPALIVFLAYFVTRRESVINNKGTLMPAAMTVGFIAGAVVVADLGTALVLTATAAVIFYVAGLERRYFVAAAGIATVCVFLAIISKPYRMVRIFAYLDPEYKLLETRAVKMVDPEGKFKKVLQRSAASRDPDYHVRQSLIAVGSGGPAGLGPMQGNQKLFYLPEAHTDFIYAVIGEELGIWGCLFVVAGFVIILWRGLRLYLRTPDHFGRYLALGVTTMIVIQALFNVSVVLGMVPPKGIPLPMISYGGSSLLSTLISLGMLQSVGEHSG